MSPEIVCTGKHFVALSTLERLIEGWHVVVELLELLLVHVSLGENNRYRTEHESDLRQKSPQLYMLL